LLGWIKRTFRERLEMICVDLMKKKRKGKEGGWWDCEEEKNPRKGIFVVKDP
jgi:hypothetical protein